MACFALLVGCKSDDGSTTSTSVGGTMGSGSADGMMDGGGTTGNDGGSGNASIDSSGDDGSNDTSAGGTTNASGDATATATDSGMTGDKAAFRFASINVRDPHFYSDQGIIGCVDITDMVPLMPGASVNEQFNTAINNDEGPNMMPDGNLDLNLLLIFRGEDQTDGAGADVDFANGTCPVGGGDCDLLAGSMLYNTTYTSSAAGPCEHIEAADLGGYNPAPATTPGPCFHAGPADVEIVTSAFTLPLGMAEISGTWNGDPATGLMNGSLRGFLSDADAAATTLPPDLQMSANAMTVADLLGGSPNGCGPMADHDDGGWWFYADFTALSYGWNGM